MRRLELSLLNFFYTSLISFLYHRLYYYVPENEKTWYWVLFVVWTVFSLVWGWRAVKTVLKDRK